MDYSTLIGAASGCGVLVIGKLIEWYTARSNSRILERKQEADTSIPLNDQAVTVYREIVESMRKDTEVMKESIHYLEKALLDCREAALATKALAESQKYEIEALKRQVADLAARARP